MLNVSLIAYTPEPEKVVAAAAKLCYSNAHIDDLLSGLTPEEAEQALNQVGLYMEATGASQYYTSATRAFDQSVAEGESVEPGSVITVTFRDSSETENETDVIG